MLNEITITLSVEQLHLLNLLVSQSNEYIFSHLKTNYTHVINDEKLNSKFLMDSVTYDSGIYTTENSGKLFDQENNSVTFGESKLNAQSSISLFAKK